APMAGPLDRAGAGGGLAPADAAPVFHRVLRGSGRRRSPPDAEPSRLRDRGRIPLGRGLAFPGGTGRRRHGASLHRGKFALSPAGRCVPRHHHDRRRHRRGAVPRLRPGARRGGRPGPQLAVLRQPALHQRLPLPGRMAAGAERRPPGPHRPGVLARPGRKDLRPAQTAGPGCRRVRLDPGGCPRLRLRRRRPHGPRRACRPARDRPRPWRPGRGRRPPVAGRPGRAGPLRARRLLNPPPHAASPGRVLRPADASSMARPDGPPPLSTTNPDMSISPLSPLEDIKTGSRFLRGTIARELDNPVTGAIPEADTKLLKFHGSYMQDDRDIRDERRKQKLEPAYAFMVRARLPGGVISPDQWLALDELAQKYATRGLRITTRQTFQWHGILKRNLRAFMQGIHDARATTIAACGDVNRQVISSVNPHLSSQHALTQEWV